jgi:hypothetical protein
MPDKAHEADQLDEEAERLDKLAKTTRENADSFYVEQTADLKKVDHHITRAREALRKAGVPEGPA